ncbi:MULTISPECIES: M15 family metallopeptidase [Proteus]|uniref:M15 family metallopeptidase n=1 Tax=Proteus TaxID=583 RepID=UPI0013768B3E|nr:M15 family metallopeptidase [Proteus columbae]MBG3020231.1 M15 family metallopeptidase [Proteus mirabilis]MBI6215423.1 M15 family metallopeptidase [Proteus vulgaris]NBM90484.1 M15 family peptidase [Proteus sp. G2658]HEH1844156.1 M15 family metallopeptidase [Proteus mirabilis]
MNKFIFSQRSKNNLIGVNPLLVKIAYRALAISTADFAVIEGIRTLEKQKENVKKGVSKTLNSRHLTGDAIDILPSVIKPGMEWKPHFFEPILRAFKQAADEEGVTLRFGKNWKSDPNLPVETRFPDYPHIEVLK